MPERRPPSALARGGESVPSADAGAVLAADYGIAVRTGLHCAPLVHAELGTLETGAVGFSLGHLTSDEDVDWAVEAMAAIAGG